MRLIAVHLLILVTHSCLSNAFGLKHQESFRGSSYEFVALQRSFFSAQAWCEEVGGHLAFIQDEETEYFLQRHLDPETDVWIGIAPSTSDLQYSPNAQGKQERKWGQQTTAMLNINVPAQSKIEWNKRLSWISDQVFTYYRCHSAFGLAST